jgi:NADPH:quinone reductase
VSSSGTGAAPNRAVIVDPGSPSGMRLADAPEPSVGSRQVLVAVQHASLNRGDLNDARSGRLPPGAVLGSDAAGCVLRPAADGDGPPAGARVVGLVRGAFAQRIAVDLDALAELPQDVDLAHAAALPVAGLAALQALRESRVVARQRVLVTGAAGGVGRFAVQIAAHAGAHVIACVGSVSRGEGLRRSGADEVVTGLDQIDEPVDVVLENVGGSQLVQAWSLLAPGGTLESIGWSSGEPAIFSPYSTIGPGKTLRSFLIAGPPGPDLTTLGQLLADGIVTVEIGWRGPVQQIHEAADALRDRRINGKAVLDMWA